MKSNSRKKRVLSRLATVSSKHRLLQGTKNLSNLVASKDCYSNFPAGPLHLLHLDISINPKRCTVVYLSLYEMETSPFLKKKILEWPALVSNRYPTDATMAWLGTRTTFMLLIFISSFFLPETLSQLNGFFTSTREKRNVRRRRF